MAVSFGNLDLGSGIDANFCAFGLARRSFSPFRSTATRGEDDDSAGWPTMRGPRVPVPDDFVASPVNQSVSHSCETASRKLLTSMT